MKKALLDLTVEEFTYLLCGREKTYHLELCLKSEDEPCEIKGTFEELERANRPFESLHKDIVDKYFDFDMDLTELDIYDYIDYHTKGFERERLKCLWRDMNYTKSMIIDEDFEECVVENGERIYKINGEEVSEKTLEYSAYPYYRTMGMIKQKLREYAKAEQVEQPSQPAPTDTPKQGKPTAQEPQQAAPESQQERQATTDDLHLPSNIDTDRARKYFPIAISKKWMKQTENGCKWEFGGNRFQRRLGYFLVKVYGTVGRPISELEKFFGVQNLAASMYQAGTNIDEVTRTDARDWRTEIDSIFDD